MSLTIADRLRERGLGGLWQLEHALYRATSPLLSRGLSISVDDARPTEEHGRGGGRYAIVAGSLDEGSIVYSLGVGRDIAFDRSLIARYGVRVHAFDPSPESARFVAEGHMPDAFLFTPIGIGAADGERTLQRLPKGLRFSMSTTANVRHRATSAAPVRMRRLVEVMRERGHDRIDLLKIDIEGGEYEVLEDVIATGIDVRQIAVQFHPHVVHLERRGVMMGRAGFRAMRVIVDAQRARGFGVVWVSRRGTEITLTR